MLISLVVQVERQPDRVERLTPVRVRPPSFGVGNANGRLNRDPSVSRSVRRVTGLLDSPTCIVPRPRNRRGTGQVNRSSNDPVVAFKCSADVRLFDAKRARVTRAGLDARARPAPLADTSRECGRAAPCGASAAADARPDACATSAAGAGRRGAEPSAWKRMNELVVGSENAAHVNRRSLTNMLSERRMCVPLSHTSATVARPSK